MEKGVVLRLFSLHQKSQRGSVSWAIKTRLDHVFGVVVSCVKVHVSETVVDAEVFDMEEVVVRVEVSAIFVGWLLCVPELVVHAELEHQSIKGGRSEAIANAKSHLQQEEEKLFRHPVPVYVRVKGESPMKIVMQLVGVFVHLWEVGHSVLVVEKLKPVRPVSGDGVRKSFSDLEISIQGPKPERDSDAGVHHVKKNDECVGLGVEEAPHGVGERLLEGELLGRGEGVAVDAEGLVRKEEPNHKCWSNRKVAIWCNDVDYGKDCFRGNCCHD